MVMERDRSDTCDKTEKEAHRGDVRPGGAGHIRGPHNCGYCDTAVKEAIKEFNITQDLNILEGLNCDCKDRWHALMRFDEFLFGSTIE